MSDKKAEESLNLRAHQESQKSEVVTRKPEVRTEGGFRVHGAEKNVRTEADNKRIDEIKDEITELQGELAALERKPVSKEEEKKQKEMIENTDHSRTANENVEAGGNPTGTVPGGTT